MDIYSDVIAGSQEIAAVKFEGVMKYNLDKF
jgi:hypothetical protein